ncbi:hypothetical protein V2J09_008914 [Rumex salicifolius]
MHYVLVDGMCHGAWCWYKVKPLLESAGHTVTALDMGASGIDTTPVEEVRCFTDYNEPLLSLVASLPADGGDKVALVGHCLVGMNLPLSWRSSPTRSLPPSSWPPSFLTPYTHPSISLRSKFEAANIWLDCKFSTLGGPDDPLTVVSFGEKFSSALYDSSPIEDYELAKMLVRPLPNFTTDLGKGVKLTDERYGLVPRVYVICKGDKGIPPEFARQMIESSEQ